MARKTFTNELNQKAWEGYEAIHRPRLEQKTNSDQKKISASINQYRSAVYTLDDMCCGESFENLTVERLHMAFESNPTKHNHMTAFIKDIYRFGICKVPVETVIETLDEVTADVVRRLTA